MEHSLLVMMYSTVWPGRSFTPPAEELLRRNRGDTCFLVVTRLFRDALAHDEFLDVHISARKTFLVARQNCACGLNPANVRFKVVCFREDRRVAQITDHSTSRKWSEHKSTTGCRMLRFVKRAGFDFSHPFERMPNSSLIILDNSLPPWYSSLQLGLRAAPVNRRGIAP